MHGRTQRQIMRRGGWLSLAWVVTAACGSSGTSSGNAPSAQVDHDALEQRAGRLILDALATSSTERAALTELDMASAAGVPWARRALERNATTADIRPETRTALVVLLAKRGDEDAITALRQATAEDSTTIAARLAWIDDDAFQRELPGALRHASEQVRRAGLTRLRTLPLTPQLALEVEVLARRDPAPEVRATAIEALASQRLVSIALLQERLVDRDPMVRAVTMRQLARLDCARAQVLLADRLGAAPSRDGLAAIRALAPCGASALLTTLDALRRGLLVSDNALRAEAAMTADAFQWRRVPDWLAHTLAHDPTPAVVLALAVALQRTQAEVAHATLHKLASAQHPVVSVQAATLLAELEDAVALPILRAARSHADHATRRAAFRALARHGELDDLAPGLDDQDVSVRLATAGSILRAAR